MALPPEGRGSLHDGNLRAGSERESAAANPDDPHFDGPHSDVLRPDEHAVRAGLRTRPGYAPYPTRDFLCLDCVIPGGCTPLLTSHLMPAMATVASLATFLIFIFPRPVPAGRG